MSMNWDNIEIISEEEEFLKTSDNDIINFDASDRMIIYSGQPGAQGSEGPAGRSGTIAVGTVTTLPAGSNATVTNVGTNTDAIFDFGIPRGESGGGGASMWGEITGDIDDQTDLKNALDAKANTADLGSLAYQNSVDYSTEVTNKPTLGTMAAVNDAPSDNKEYARKNGSWSEVTGGVGSVDWGDIGGTLSDQTDLKNALDAKANTADLGDLASKDSVDYLTEVTNKPTLGTMAAVNDASSDSKLYGRKNGAWSEVPTPSAPEWGDIGGTLADQTDLANALAAKANTADLGTLASQNKVDWDTDIDDIPSTFPPSSHTHGNITNGGAISSDTAVASGDKLVLADASDSSKLIRSEISFDGSTTTKGLTPKGTWESFAAASHNHDDRYYTETEIDNSLALKANNSIIADAFSTSTAYAVGDYVIYQGVLYRFTSAHSAGAWSGTDATAVTIDDELALKANASDLSSYAPLASPALTGTPTAPTASSGTNTTQIATTAFVHGELSKEIMYFFEQTCSAVTSSTIFTITNAAITTDTVVLECTFSKPSAITSNVAWESFSGYITFSGTCTDGTCKANVTLGTKGN